LRNHFAISFLSIQKLRNSLRNHQFAKIRPQLDKLIYYFIAKLLFFSIQTYRSPLPTLEILWVLDVGSNIQLNSHQFHHPFSVQNKFSFASFEQVEEAYFGDKNNIM
jgi:hypothetical protein